MNSEFPLNGCDSESGHVAASSAVSVEVAGNLRVLVPSGPVTLTAIHPIHGMGPSKTFEMPEQADGAGHWAQIHNAMGSNIYWMPNSAARRDCRVKADEVSVARYAWADCDPDVKRLGSYEAARADLDERVLPKLVESASVVVDSGNGYQALFRLDQDVPLAHPDVRIAYTELNRKIGEAFDGPSTFDPSRILRVPGTLNYPNNAKIKKGYPAAPSVSCVIQASARAFGPDDLRALVNRVAMVSAAAGIPIPLKARLDHLLEINARARMRYDGGVDGLADRSGSARELSMVSHLKAGGFTLQETKTLLAEWAHGSESGRAQGDRYWQRMWDKVELQTSGVGVPPASGGYDLLTVQDLAALPTVEWVVPQILPRRGIGAIFGATGSGKTFLALDVAAHIVLGKDWFGRVPSKCSVTYVALEGGYGIHQRLNAFQRHHQIQLPDDFRVVLKHVSLFGGDDIDRLAEAIREAGHAGGLIFIDTLNQSAPQADENTSQDMGRIIRSAQILQQLTDSLVVLIHHSGKDQTRGLRGHSSLLAALDVALEVRADASGSAWSVAKSKDSRSGITHQFAYETVDLGVDAAGETISSRVVVSTCLPPKTTKAGPTGSHQRLAMAEINTLFQRIPAGQARAVALESAMAAVMAKMVVEAKRRRSRAVSAIESLVANGYFELRDECLWPI